jgi:hypothetical protein
VVTDEFNGDNSSLFRAPLSGAALLDAVEAFLARFIAYPSGDARLAHTLWTAHAHLMDSWESTPRIAFLSPEPGSGKSRALEVTELLVPRPVHAVNTTPAYLFRKVSDEAGPPTLLYDEIDTVFGPKAKDNEDIRGMLNAGHRRGATAGRCVLRGKTVETEELPAYCAVALAGLDDLPDTIATRSIIVRMRRRAPDEHVEPFRNRVNAPEGYRLRDMLANWANDISEAVAGVWPKMPDGIEDRNADVWEALLAIADAAGGEWPDRARCSAVALVADSKRASGSLGVRLLADIRDAFSRSEDDKISTDDLLDYLITIDEAPWGDLRGKPLDARGLSRRLSKYDIQPKNIRLGSRICKGYDRGDLIDAWSRYLPVAGNDAITTKSKEIIPISDTTVTNGAGSASLQGDSSATTATPLHPRTYYAGIGPSEKPAQPAQPAPGPNGPPVADFEQLGRDHRLRVVGESA